MGKYQFGWNPASEFDTGILKGFDPCLISQNDYSTARAHALYATLDASLDDDEYVIGALPNGKWALVGATTPHAFFSIE